MCYVCSFLHPLVAVRGSCYFHTGLLHSTYYLVYLAPLVLVGVGWMVRSMLCYHGMEILLFMMKANVLESENFFFFPEGELV